MARRARWPRRPPGEHHPSSEERVVSEPPDARDPAGVDPGRRARTRVLTLVAVAVLLADLASKLVVVAKIPPGQDIRMLGGLVYLTQLRNVGAAFSFAEGATVLFSLIAVAVTVVIIRTARRLYSTGWAVTLGLVLGGAVGNLIDRLFREPGFLRGGVVDFVSVFAPDGRIWPVFNVADSAIVCGGILGVLLAVRGVEFDGSRARARPEPRGAAAPAWGSGCGGLSGATVTMGAVTSSAGLHRALPVPDGLEGQRVDQALSRLLGLSPPPAAEVADAGNVIVDGRVRGKGDRLTGGSWLEVELPPPGEPV